MRLFRPRQTLWLVKDSNDFISHCKCRNAPIACPVQLDCPWCGCGWLFSCLYCRKSFTFARAILTKETIEEFAAYDVQKWRPKLALNSKEGKDEIQEWIDEMQQLLRDVRLGERYVYFDGCAVPADAIGIRFQGSCRFHDLNYVPQIRALTDPAAAQLLRDCGYWTAERDVDGA